MAQAPVIAVFNQKGGVGKTTTALNLLAGIALRKQRPLGIDLDPQAHLSSIFGVHPRLADDSVYAFFMRQRPLSDLAQITSSGVILLAGRASVKPPCAPRTDDSRPALTSTWKILAKCFSGTP